MSEQLKNEQESQPKNECKCAAIFKDKKKLAIIGGIVLILLIIICSLSGETRKTNVSIDLPNGGKVVVGVLDISKNAVKLSNIQIDALDMGKGAIGEVVLADIDVLKLNKGAIDEIGLVEIKNASFDGASIEYLKYEGFKLDFPFLASINPQQVTLNDIKKLFESFSIKKVEMRNVKNADENAVAIIKSISADNFSMKHSENYLSQGLNISMDGESFLSIDKISFKFADFPNIANLFNADENTPINTLASAFDGASVKGFEISNLKAKYPYIDLPWQISNFSFDLSDGDESGYLNAKFEGAEISGEILKAFGSKSENIPNVIKANGTVNCDAKNIKDNYTEVVHQISLNSAELANVKYDGTIFFSDGNFDDFDIAAFDLSVKDNGIVNFIPAYMKMQIIKDVSFEPQIENALRVFFDTPKATLKMQMLNDNGNVQLSTEVVEE